uniref:hypothetical protein n=1 Tax=Hassallia byssoidea TaxID=482630 RepID=UPI001914B27B|nr:hypothetical protein [Hassalia byssoidea]
MLEALEILINKIKKPYLLSKLCEHYDSPMLTAHHLLIIDFFSRLNDQQMARIIPVLTQQIEELPYGLDDLLELVFCGKTIPEGTTINELTDVQQFLLTAIADDETTLTSNVRYMGGILEKLGSQGSVVREKLIGFLNGEKLEYDR